MTREEEKNKARFKYVSKRLANPDYPTYNDEYELECAYDAGAMWADEHPVSCNNKAALYFNNIVYENGYKEAIDKACEWLEEHHVPSAFGDMSKVKDFVEQFRKAMKGEEDEDHFIDANKKVDRVIGTAEHIKTALDVLNKEGGEE